MPNRNLTPDELEKANTLLGEIRQRLDALSAGDRELLFAYRRKVYKELTYDERSKPMVRKKLKAQKRSEQDGLCARCRKSLPETYCVLDRLVASEGYTPENTRLLCPECDVAAQHEKGYT